jgi:predicted GIY-YIG superfamily endonuclease
MKIGKSRNFRPFLLPKRGNKRYTTSVDLKWAVFSFGEPRAGKHDAKGFNVENKYLKMIRGMKKKGRREWTVYILRCGDGSLYTGIAKDVETRVKQHLEGRGATYTRTRLPVTLVYQQGNLTHSKALIREAQIKRMPRSKKEEMMIAIA